MCLSPVQGGDHVSNPQEINRPPDQRKSIDFNSKCSGTIFSFSVIASGVDELMTRPANTDSSLEINAWKRSHGVFFFHTVGLHKRNVCFYLIFTRTAASSLSSAPLEFLLVRFFACALSALCSSRPLTFSFMRFSKELKNEGTRCD